MKTEPDNRMYQQLPMSSGLKREEHPVRSESCSTSRNDCYTIWGENTIISTQTLGDLKTGVEGHKGHSTCRSIMTQRSHTHAHKRTILNYTIQVFSELSFWMGILILFYFFIEGKPDVLIFSKPTFALIIAFFHQHLVWIENIMQVHGACRLSADVTFRENMAETWGVKHVPRTQDVFCLR